MRRAPWWRPRWRRGWRRAARAWTARACVPMGGEVPTVGRWRARGREASCARLTARATRLRARASAMTGGRGSRAPRRRARRSAASTGGAASTSDATVRTASAVPIVVTSSVRTDALVTVCARPRAAVNASVAGAATTARSASALAMRRVGLHAQGTATASSPPTAPVVVSAHARRAGLARGVSYRGVASMTAQATASACAEGACARTGTRAKTARSPRAWAQTTAPATADACTASASASTADTDPTARFTHARAEEIAPATACAVLRRASVSATAAGTAPAARSVRARTTAVATACATTALATARRGAREPSARPPRVQTYAPPMVHAP